MALMVSDQAKAVGGYLTAINEFGSEQHVGILEHALFQRHDNKL